MRGARLAATGAARARARARGHTASDQRAAIEALFAADMHDPASLGFDPGRLERARDVGRQYVDAGAMPCAQVLVSRAGKVALVDSYGWADLGDPATGEAPEMQPGRPPRPLAPDAIFRQICMGKPVVCARQSTSHKWCEN